MLIVTSPGTVLAAMGSVYAASGGWGALFFVIFVIIGNMVIYKVVLATAYRSFKSFMKRELLRKMRNRRICHAEAFELLTNDGTITAKVWRRLFLQMQEQQSFHWLWLKDHHGQGCCWGVFQCCTCWRGRDKEAAKEKRVKQAHRRAMRKSRAISKLRGQDHENATAISQGPEHSPSTVTAYSPRDSNVHSMLLHYRLAANAIFSEIDFDNSGLIEQAEFDRGIALAQQASVEINREQTGRTHNNQSPQSDQAMSVNVLQKLKARLEHGRKWLRHVFEFDVLRCPCFQTLQVEHGARASTPDPGRSMAVSSKRMDQKPAHHHAFPVADLLIDLVVILSCVSIYFDTEHRIVQAATTAAAVPHNSSGMITPDSGGSAQVVGQGNIGGSTSASPEYVIWRVIGTITMVLFFAEVCLRVFAFGLREYLIMPMHKLDIFCVATGLLFFIVTWLDTSISANGNPLYNLFLVLRASRMIRLLWFIPALRGMLWTVGKLVPSLLELLSILFVPMYMGASIGHIFLGECLVYPIKNPAINVTAPATAKLLAKWLPVGGMLQFDTPGRAMLDMFEMANIASWNIVMDAGSALCGPRWASPLYFFTERIVLHMVFIPIIVGFIIEQFVKKYEWWEHHEDATDRDTRKRTEGKGGGSSGDNDSLLTADPLVEGKGEEGLEGEHPEQNTTRERAGSLAPKDHKVLVSQPLNDGLRSIYVSVRKENPSMEGAPSEDTDIFNVSADIAAEQAAEQAAENIALRERVQFLESTIANSHASLAEARKKERKMQRQIETLKSELKKRMASVKN